MVDYNITIPIKCKTAKKIKSVIGDFTYITLGDWWLDMFLGYMFGCVAGFLFVVNIGWDNSVSPPIKTPLFGVSLLCFPICIIIGIFISHFIRTNNFNIHCIKEV